MAHVIQLCLKQLLEHIRAGPENKEVMNVCSDSKPNCLADSAEDGDMAHALTKVKVLPIQLTRGQANIVAPSRLSTVNYPIPSVSRQLGGKLSRVGEGTLKLPYANYAGR